MHIIRRSAVILSFVSILLLAGCGKPQSCEKTGFYFDTDVTIRVDGDNAEKLVTESMNKCEELEDIFSPTKKTSELYKINNRTKQTITVSDDMASCLSEGLKWSKESDGVFDVTIRPVSELWDFHADDPKVPSENEIEDALAKVDYTKVHLDGNTLSFDSPDTQIDLGGIAKGYASGVIKQMLRNEGASSALINLGGNVSTLGTKTDGSKWKIGIQKPFADRGEVLTSVDSSDSCVISSGIYERYFKKDGKLYYHIIDPRTGYPAETDLNQATIIGTGEDDADCDALSTICVLLGRDKAEEFLKKNGIANKVLFTDKNNGMTWYPTENAD